MKAVSFESLFKSNKTWLSRIKWSCLLPIWILWLLLIIVIITVSRSLVKTYGASVKVSFYMNLAYYNITLHFWIILFKKVQIWFLNGLFILLLAFAVFEFCGKDFESINWHKWGCKLTSNNTVNPEIINNRLIANIEYISCSCGKQCKGLRGSKAHQRSCRANKSMSEW